MTEIEKVSNEINDEFIEMWGKIMLSKKRFKRAIIRYQFDYYNFVYNDLDTETIRNAFKMDYGDFKEIKERIGRKEIPFKEKFKELSLNTDSMFKLSIIYAYKKMLKKSD